MLRSPFSLLAPALLAALPLLAVAQTPVDSVVRTTTVTTITTTTVVKPASGVSSEAPVTTTSSTSSTTTTSPTVTRRPGPGDLTGARPKPAPTPKASTASKASAKAVPTSRVVTAPARAAATTTTRSTTADPELTRMVQQNVDLSKVRAEQMPNLYEQFMETTRAERRQWTSTQWDSASAVLSRLNQRYEQVRDDLSLEEKLNIRTLQGEFHGLRAARQISKSL